MTIDDVKHNAEERLKIVEHSVEQHQKTARALKKFGRHLYTCRQNPCDCGYAAEGGWPVKKLLLFAVVLILVAMVGCCSRCRALPDREQDIFGEGR